MTLLLQNYISQFEKQERHDVTSDTDELQSAVADRHLACVHMRDPACRIPRNSISCIVKCECNNMF
jgi:hypothetical protein